VTDPDAPVSVFRLDPELVDAVVSGDADRRADAALADQVASVLPWHAAVPPEIAGHLTRLVRYLGGDEALLRWLDEHRGRPRLVARAYRLVGLLDGISASSAVVAALRELRDRTKYPPGLEAYLPPDTDSGTLASLGQQIEALLGEGRADDAVAVSLATTAMLRELAPRAAELDPELRGLDILLEHLRHGIEEAREA
jgi:hypothetical protein